jgi:hypothetical protein
MSAIKRELNEVLDEQALVQLPVVMPVSTSSVALGTLQASNPAALVAGAAELASQLAIVIAKQNLATVIKGKRFVNVEGWTTLATMLGVTAREVCTVEFEGVYVATVELVRMSDGACISRASAECGSSDELDKYGKPIWSTRPRYARRSMAQTRATGKACRLAFSWIMSLAGYEVTPAEEMTPIIEAEQVQERPAPAPRKTKTQTQTAESVCSTVPEPQAPIEPSEPQRITASQQKLLEAQIRDYGLDRERVKAWLKSAWKVEHFQDLSPKQFERLLIKLENWASDSYAKAEAASALSRDAANF